MKYKVGDEVILKDTCELYSKGKQIKLFDRNARVCGREEIGLYSVQVNVGNAIIIFTICENDIERKVQTNRQWIESLSDEEMAEFLWRKWFFDDSRELEFLEWLQAEYTGQKV